MIIILYTKQMKVAKYAVFIKNITKNKFFFLECIKLYPWGFYNNFNKKIWWYKMMWFFLRVLFKIFLKLIYFNLWNININKLLYIYNLFNNYANLFIPNIMQYYICINEIEIYFISSFLYNIMVGNKKIHIIILIIINNIHTRA